MGVAGGYLAGVLRRLDHPLLPAVLSVVAALVLVFARLIFAAHHDITQFVVVGSANLVGHGLPPHIHVFGGTTPTGYDGQFYYRQALDPFDVHRVAFGIRLDGWYRLQRIGYPFLAWVLSAGGRPGLVPDALVAVNVVAFGAIGLFGGVMAHDAGRHASFGLLFPAFFGFVTSISRDLLEVTAAAFLLGGLVALRRGRYLIAALALSCDVLTKETDMFVVAAIGLVIVLLSLVPRSWQNPRPPLSANLVWLLPVIAFAGLQLALYDATNVFVATSGANGNFGTPATAAVDAFNRYSSHPLRLANAIWLGELVVLGVVVLVALFSIRHTKALMHERLAFVVLIALALCLSTEVWYGQADFRAMAPLYELAMVILIGTKRRLWLVGTLAAAAFLVTFVHRVRFT